MNFRYEVGDMIIQRERYTYSAPPVEPAIVLEVLLHGYKVFFPEGVFELSLDYAHGRCKLLSKTGAKSTTGEV